MGNQTRDFLKVRQCATTTIELKPKTIKQFWAIVTMKQIALKEIKLSYLTAPQQPINGCKPISFRDIFGLVCFLIMLADDGIKG